MLDSDDPTRRSAATTQGLQDAHRAAPQVHALPSGLDVDLVQPALDLGIPDLGLEPRAPGIAGVQVEARELLGRQSRCRSSAPV